MESFPASKKGVLLGKVIIFKLRVDVLQSRITPEVGAICATSSMPRVANEIKLFDI
jgi:hypothetical protein